MLSIHFGGPRWRISRYYYLICGGHLAWYCVSTLSAANFSSCLSAAFVYVLAYRALVRFNPVYIFLFV